MTKYRQTALPPEYTRTSGKPSNEQYRGMGEGQRPVTKNSANGANIGANNPVNSGRLTGHSVGVLSFSTSVIQLNDQNNFQLLAMNTRRRYLQITAVSGDICIAFGRSISEASYLVEYRLLSGTSLTFDSDNAPSSTVNIAGTNAAPYIVSVMEGSLL